MNILTVNLLFSTFVFWVAARIYVFPKLADLKPQTLLVPILLLHAFRHLGLMFLTPGATYAGIPPRFAYPAAFVRPARRLACFDRDSCLGEKCSERTIPRVGLQRRRNAGPLQCYNARNNLPGATLHGPSLLDSRILGSCVVGNALHYVRVPLEILEATARIEMM